MNQEFRKLCRLCGKDTGFLMNIFDSTPECLIKIEAVIPDVVILRHDSLPKQVCHRCVSKVKDFYEFRATCIQTQENLRKRLPWMSSNYKSGQIFKASKPASPVVTFLGGPLAHPFGDKEPEVEVLTLSDDEDENKTNAFSTSISPGHTVLQTQPERLQLDSNANHTSNGNQSTVIQPAYPPLPVCNNNLQPNSSPLTTANMSIGNSVIQSTCELPSKKLSTESITKTIKNSLGTRHKPKPKCKKRPHELEPTETNFTKILNLYPTFVFVKKCENTTIFTCTQCNQIVVSEEAVIAHKCVQSCDNESNLLLSDKNEDCNRTASSSIELTISDDESSECKLTPKHCCGTCGKLFHNLGRLQRHEAADHV